MTDPTMPPNAPEAGSNGEREALIDMIRRTWPAVPGELADAILAAGFTRAHHDGERVAALEKERDAAINNHACLKQVWDDQCAHVLEACKMLGADTDAQPGDSWTLREWCVRVVRERDAAMSLAEGAHAQFASCCAIAFEVDTMAVDDERMLTLEDRIADTIEARDAAAHDRDAAIARAEAAEAKLAEAEKEIEYARFLHGNQVSEVMKAWDARDASDKRAAALAEILRHLRQDIQHHNCASETCDACEIDAALAGNGADPIGVADHARIVEGLREKFAGKLPSSAEVNGNGTGEGDGWIACSERMPPKGRIAITFIPMHDGNWNMKTLPFDGERWWGLEEWAHQPTHWRPLPAAPPSAGSEVP